MKIHYYDRHKEEIGYMDIVENFIDSKIILDAGCGSGWIGKYIKMYNKNIIIIGIDIDVIGLKMIQYEIPILGDCNKFPIKSNSIDGIIAKDILEHSNNPLNIMNEFNRVLKQNGILYISVPDQASKTFWDDYTHIRPYNKKSAISILEDTGFRIDQLWYNSSFPGLGIIIKLLNKHRTPKLIKLFASLGINRNNIILIARKI